MKQKIKYKEMNDKNYDKFKQELDEQEIRLNEQEEKDLEELLELQKEFSEKHNILDDMSKAALQGVEDYLNSFIDISEIVSDFKNPDNIKSRQDNEIPYNGISADKGSEPHYRTLRDAKESPYSFDSKRDNSLMSEKGRERLAYYEKSYRQRLKMVGEHKGSNKLNHPNSNLSLAGIRSYRFGPVVSCYTPDEYKQMWEKEQRPNTSLAGWIRQKNYAKLDGECYKEFGFETVEDFSKWRSENKLTPHETSDGIFLVPNDVHNNERHAGLQSAIHHYIEGKITREDLDKFRRDARIEFIRNECKVRGTRVVKGASLAAVKALVQKTSSIIVAETYNEFKVKTEESFFIRMKRLVEKCYDRLKIELKAIWQPMIQSSLCSVGMEIFTALNDFIFKTAKNIFKILRAMIGSIIRAFKVIFSNKYTWQERIYEALKIISAGFVAAVGFSLNDIIAKCVSAIPLLVPFAPFIADVFSGLFASIMSALVLVAFDRYKDRLQIKHKRTKEMLLADKIVCYELARTEVSNLKTTIAVAETVQVVHDSMAYMVNKDREVSASLALVTDNNYKIKNLSAENTKTKDDITNLLEQMRQL